MQKIATTKKEPKLAEAYKMYKKCQSAKIATTTKMQQKCNQKTPKSANNFQQV